MGQTPCCMTRVLVLHEDKVLVARRIPGTTKTWKVRERVWWRRLLQRAKIQSAFFLLHNVASIKHLPKTEEVETNKQTNILG